jgi:hypothetical protein
MRADNHVLQKPAVSGTPIHKLRILNDAEGSFGVQLYMVLKLGHSGQ